ncbi:hypothetical protein K469DRAFT_697599 [Zopfia rhizophila CBS 207.26]|uniref:Uncharacterized protein n=1 Tax=Zopfia rhizophila CBS 207.26 TaxID=1314779 RepID=A0A6A6DC02_9PEZI|nr:hypothetical protein K469DRAFT_697599 [Zopfia rhizophila CBS 207.26]
MAIGVNTLSNLNPPVPRDTFYTVYPTDPSNADQVANTEKFLQNLYGKEDVIENRNADGLVSWRITLKDGDTTDQLEAHQGLRVVEPEDRPKGVIAKAKRSELARRDDPIYIALASDPDNDEQTKATREFLNSKVTDPNKFIIELHKPGTNKILAWGQLSLNDAAKAEVEGHEGIKAPLGEDGDMDNERAAPRDDGYFEFE